MVPVIYTLCVLEKKIKKGLWDFSFKVEDLNKKITLFSLLIFVFSLSISYCFIWPLLAITISYFSFIKHFFFTEFIDLLKISIKKNIFFALPLLLGSNANVEEIFRHFTSDIFSKEDVKEAVDSPRHAWINEDKKDVSDHRFSENLWLSPNSSRKYVNVNMQRSANTIKVPYIPRNRFNSFWDVPEISNRLLKFESITYKQTMLNIVQFYFNDRSGFYTIFGGTEPKSPIDFQTTLNSKKHCMVLSRTESWAYLLQKLHIQANDSFKGQCSQGKSPYIILHRDQYIAFAEYNPDYHKENFPFKKQELKPRENIQPANYKGILGLVATTRGVETVSQRNIYSPQLAWYDITNQKQAFAIHILFKYLSLNPNLVDRGADFDVIPENVDLSIKLDVTSPNSNSEEDNVGFLLNKTGTLVRASN